jgi:cupin superfamily acireductone dioxygenase involved in methionine salvage
MNKLRSNYTCWKTFSHSDNIVYFLITHDNKFQYKSKDNALTEVRPSHTELIALPKEYFSQSAD